jgi:hypothetical protein
MRIDLDEQELLLLQTLLDREAHEQTDFATTPGVVGTATAVSFTTRAAAARALAAKLEQAALAEFKAAAGLGGREPSARDEVTGDLGVCVRCKRPLIVREGRATCPLATAPGRTCEPSDR